MIYTTPPFADKSEIESDICIIGGGAAGITIALQFANTKKKVILLAGGDWKESINNRELNKGFVNPGTHHEPLEENRRRQFGGATAAWGGRCIPFDAIDFEKRDWLPNNDWPITETDIFKYYEPALQMCDAGSKFDFDARSVFAGTQNEIIKNLDNGDIVSWPLERWSSPINFAKKYRDVFEKSANLTVYLNAHVTNINFSEKDKKTVDNVDLIINKTTFKIKAHTFILATGGIENARLLLASKSEQSPNGIGNHHDNVGRYYMSHFTGTYAIVDPIDRKNIVFDFEKDKEGVYCRRRWWLSAEAQKKYKIGNVIFFLHRSLSGEGHRDSIFSVVYLAKTTLKILKQRRFKSIMQTWKESKTEFKQHLQIIVKDSPSLVPKLFNLAKMRFAKRRLPFILPSINSKQFHLYFQTEHLPFRNSRIFLSDKLDRLGNPLPIVNFEFQKIDIDTILKAHKVFIDRFNQLKLGEIIYNEKEFRDFLKVKIENFNSSAHHLGTTRMSENPETGVVDKNCKVFGVDNLFIAGSSIFSTGGHANPTLLIVNLALRLADYLKKSE